MTTGDTIKPYLICDESLYHCGVSSIHRKNVVVRVLIEPMTEVHPHTPRHGLSQAVPHRSGEVKKDWAEQAIISIRKSKRPPLPPFPWPVL